MSILGFSMDGTFCWVNSGGWTEAQENDRVTELVSVGGGRTKGTSWCLLLLIVWLCQSSMLERQEAISARKVLQQKFSHLSGVVLGQIQGSWENLYP